MSTRKRDALAESLTEVRAILAKARELASVASVRARAGEPINIRMAEIHNLIRDADREMHSTRFFMEDTEDDDTEEVT